MKNNLNTLLWKDNVQRTNKSRSNTSISKKREELLKNSEPISISNKPRLVLRWHHPIPFVLLTLSLLLYVFPLFSTKTINPSAETLTPLPKDVNTVTKNIERMGVATKSYNIQPKDTLLSIAQKYSLDPDAITSLNRLKPINFTSQKIIQIPTLSGLFITTQPYDTLISISEQYHVNPESILQYNPKISKYHLNVGVTLFLKDVSYSIQQRQILYNAPFIAPMPTGKASNYDDKTGYLQIDTALSTQIISPMNATMAFSGADKDNFKKIILDHGNGFITHIEHLEKIQVDNSATVLKGQVIANALAKNPSSPAENYFLLKLTYEGTPVDPRRFISFSPTP